MSGPSDPGPRVEPNDRPSDATRPLAALDIGTNSFHLVVARPVGGDRFETLTREKEVVRLGHGGGDMKVMSPEAIDRGIAALRRMRRIADSYEAALRAVATSAVREAENASTFLDRARLEAGIDIEVISGAEEARLILLGVLQAVPVYDRRMLLVDVGGGSTELLIGERAEALASRSFKLGAVRLTDRFFPGGAVGPKAVAACREYARSILSHFQREVDEHGFDVAVASSGTAEAVAHIAHAMTGSEPLHTYNCFEFSTAELHDVVSELIKRRTVTSPRQGPRSRAGTGRHRRGRCADPRDGGDDVRRRALHVQRGRAARRSARRHRQPDERLDQQHVRRPCRWRPRRHAAPPPRRVATQHHPAGGAMRRRPGAFDARRPAGRRAVRRAGARPRPRRDGAGSTWRPARCWPTSGSSWPTASTTSTPTT